MSPPLVSFMTKGQRLAHQDSYIIINQCYVQYIPPKGYLQGQVPSGNKLPILFLHGGGLTGAIYESTPDLRPGWAIKATEAGHPTYVLDAVDGGRSQRAPDTHRQGEVQHRTAKQVWDRFRIGPSLSFDQRNAFEDSQFPVEAFDIFLASQAARRYDTDAVEIEGIKEALRRIGACCVIAHSHGAVLALEAMKETEVGNFVRKLVLIEPGPAKNDASLGWVKDLRGALIVWGDYLEGHAAWSEITKTYATEGLTAAILSLPKHGIKGNSHFPMCDRNSDEVFNVILQRLD